MLTPKKQRFAEEYLVDLNATQAAIRAGYSPKTANEQGSRLLTDVSVQRLIQEAQSRVSESTGLTVEKVLKQFEDIATTDPNEIVQVRRECCRYCYGKEHRYQYTERELEEAIARHEAKQEQNEREGHDIEEFDPRGGIGFNPKRNPNDECPECFGDGVLRVWIADTRSLSKRAKRLIAGIKQGRDGIEIKLNSQTDALANIARHLGMFKDNLDITSGGKPIGDLLGLSDLSDDELAKRIERIEAGKANPPVSS